MLALQDPALFKTQGLIGGQWQTARDQQTFAVFNPATAAHLADVASLGADETMAAITAAAAALPAWRALPAQARGERLQVWSRLLQQHAADLAQIMTAEQGKPIAEALGEIRYAASFLDWFAEEGKRTYGEVIPSPAADRRLLTLKQPIGVCAAITPWNFPAAMITRKVAPALAAGCTIIVKPAEQTPLTALALAELAQRAGLPPGVLNVITGEAAVIGATLTASPLVRKLSFTGSTEIGRLLMQQSAPTIKKLSLELGGNAPFIVFDDADVAAAVQGAIQSKYRNAGQTCVCANRLFVQAGIYDQFAEAFAAQASRLRVGPGTDPQTQVGPLIDAAALEKVEQHVSQALDQGAQLMTGGHRLATEAGYFYAPTVLRDATPDMQCAREETFGPVAPLIRFHSEEEVIAWANDSEYGLASYLYSQSLARVFRVAEALEYGMVGVNTGLISNEVAPFGGIKQSGLGREGSHHGIDEYLELKYLCLGL
ncbi:NAD-dependent succinate-semialdehyde dehydrogenase [Parvibium lacunae]|uniref:NAD-dependent succinate-semialdehyde dehydrogenase n=1 Tax=Parvibium lacunae TaxID=1888893 RepID=A0A368L6M6_9BURK|nr:NAD-dependent succinate-semialdehyde dehydrogenase [Parvibium lacunae]RCS59264.1 NAD-dependent succinate-semialdehyde dehydrogenase [Parvibium lacunae]